MEMVAIGVVIVETDGDVRSEVALAGNSQSQLQTPAARIGQPSVTALVQSQSYRRSVSAEILA